MLYRGMLTVAVPARRAGATLPKAQSAPPSKPPARHAVRCPPFIIIVILPPHVPSPYILRLSAELTAAGRFNCLLCLWSIQFICSGVCTVQIK